MVIINARPKKSVNFKETERHQGVNIMLYELKKDSGEDAGSMWQLVYGNIQYKSYSRTVNTKLL